MLKPKLWPSDGDSLEKTLMLGKIECRRRRGHEMVGWHHWWNGHELGQILGPLSAYLKRLFLSGLPYQFTCPMSWWCCPTISSSVTLFSSCPQSFPASGTFLMSRLFTSDDQNTGASSPVFPASIQGWFPLRLTSLISLLFKGLPGVFSSNTASRY